MSGWTISWLLNQAGPDWMFVTVAFALVVVAVNIGALGPRTTGRALESVNTNASPPGRVPIPGR